MELEKRARKAVARWFELEGHAVLDRGFEGFVVVIEDGELVFAKVFAERGMDFPNGHVTRAEFERVIAQWLVRGDRPIDLPVRCDCVDVAVLADDRAIVRRVTNCLEVAR